ncbi:MAG: LytTR family transcriptional regulator [Lachnospiraceae bacterium]|nr:LytTR family transcriptional regulator [Lachnospiraceae bacterium]
MKIELQLDPKQQETKVIIIAEQLSEEVKTIMNKLSQEHTQVIAGFHQERLEILEPESIYRIYAASQKMYAVTEKGEYTLRSRLYELEEQLIGKNFIRISNSEIVNLKRIKNFDLSYAGTIGVVMTDGTTTFVSRRYVSKIKQALGI